MLIHNIKKTSTLTATIIAITAMLINTNALAVGISPAVVINGFDSPNHINSGDTIHAAGFGTPDSYSDSSFFNYSADGLVGGNWFTFMNYDVTDVTVSVNGDANFAPGLSVWATGSTEFNGGTSILGLEMSTAGFDSAFSFNATGHIGNAGTLWMADPSIDANGGGNVLETLGYAMTGPSHLNSTSPTGWGEDMVTGAHDVSLTNTFELGVSGSIDASAHSASLTFDNLAAGWYTVYVGGTDSALFGGDYDLTVISAVPETHTWLMLLAGLSLIGGHLKRQQRYFV